MQPAKWGLTNKKTNWSYQLPSTKLRVRSFGVIIAVEIVVVAVIVVIVIVIIIVVVVVIVLVVIV